MRKNSEGQQYEQQGLRDLWENQRLGARRSAGVLNLVKTWIERVDKEGQVKKKWELKM